MRKGDLLLIGLPFLLSAAIIWAHYSFLSRANPQAHSRPLITTRLVQTLRPSEIKPLPPQAPFPSPLLGILADIPTSRKELQDLLDRVKSEGANTLVLRVGMTLTADGNLILAQAAETSEETILTWTKKTVADAHAQGLHTYLVLMFVEGPAISDPARFAGQLKSSIERWANSAQEYFVTFFQPGITLGHPTYESLPPDKLQIFVTEIERQTREFYTGRLGIGLCCQGSLVKARGYNQLLVITEGKSDELIKLAREQARRDGVEHIYLLDPATRRVSTIQ